MPIPIRANSATLVINGTAYELRDLHVSAETSHEQEVVYGRGGRVGTTAPRVTERLTIEAEVMPAPVESDADLRARIRQSWQRPLTLETATGADLDLLAETVFGVSRETPPVQGRWDRLLADDLV